MNTSRRGAEAVPPRAKTRINPVLERKLCTYLAAAGAAGVSLMALSLPSEAKIVSTKTSLGIEGCVPLDLNADGVADFTFCRGAIGSNESLLEVQAASGYGWFRSRFPSPMFFGVPIGPGENFVGGTYGFMANFSFYGSFQGSRGAWANKTNAYMGVKFLINGQPHFGWIRLTVANLNATITGYAYETVPNAALRAGNVSGPSTNNEGRAASPSSMLVPLKKHAALGLLALGVDGLSAWRREGDCLAN